MLRCLWPSATQGHERREGRALVVGFIGRVTNECHWGATSAVAFLLGLLATPSGWRADAAEWSVEKNEQDPFDKSKSTFIAENVGGEGMLAIRCLEGTFLIGCVGAIQRVCERCR